jgi:hypothetical protein
MISPLEFRNRTVGKTVKEATKLLKDELNWDLRVKKVDGRVLDVPPDAPPRRIGVFVEKGVITDWHIDTP